MSTEGAASEGRDADLATVITQEIAEFLSDRGLVVIPREPTEDMLDEADTAFHVTWKQEREMWDRGEAVREKDGLPRRLPEGQHGLASIAFSRAIYAAMIRAALTPKD